MIRYPLALLVVMMLAGCTVPGWPRAEPTPTLFPAGPTRGPLPADATAEPPPPAPQPSATADAARLPQLYEAPGVGLSFRYPADWTISESSTPSEWLISAQSGSDGLIGYFTVNLSQVGGEVGIEELRRYAERYAATVAGLEEGSEPPIFRQEGATLIATVRRNQGPSRFEYEMRFRSESPFIVTMLLLGRESDWPAVAPLLDEMARSLAVAPPEGAAQLPTATAATGRSGEGLAAQVGTPFPSPTGALHAVGLVTNGGAQGYSDVEVTATLLDAAGTPLDSARWPIVRAYLAPGESSPVRVIFSAPPEGAVGVSIEVDGLPGARPEGRPALTTTIDAAGKPPFGEFGAQGTVTNSGADARSVTLTAVLYGPAGEVLGVESAQLEQGALASGQSAPYTITIYSRAPGEIARYEVIAEGEP